MYLGGAVESRLASFELEIPEDNEAAVEADEELGRVVGKVAEMDDLARLVLLAQLDHVVPLDVVARLREIVVHVEQVSVALLGADVQPIRLILQMHGCHPVLFFVVVVFIIIKDTFCSRDLLLRFAHQLLGEENAGLFLSQIPKREDIVVAVGDESALVDHEGHEENGRGKVECRGGQALAAAARCRVCSRRIGRGRRRLRVMAAIRVGRVV